MRTSRTFFGLVAAAAITVLPVHGQELERGPETARGNGWESCLALDVTPFEVYESLGTYQTVFGKAAIDWTEKDYMQVQELANACDGALLPQGNVVNALEWHQFMKRAMTNVFEVAYIHQVIMKRAGSMNTDEIVLPNCGELTKYVLPAKNLKDNSSAIFGVPLYGMKPNDLRAAVEHMNNCMAFLPQHGFVVYGSPAAASQKTVFAMMDRALMIQAWNEEWKLWSEKRTTDISVEFDGYEIPPTFLSDEAKAMVRRYNRAAGRNNGMTIDAVYNLVSITEGILEEPMSDIDHAYAAAIKDAVSKFIFSQSGEAAGAARLP